MIAKLIVWGNDRSQAINRMVQALEHYRIAGVKTNIRFLHTLVDTQAFRLAELTTGFIDSHRDLLFPETRLDTHRALVLAAGFILETRKLTKPAKTDPWSPFAQSDSWRMNAEYIQPLQLQVGENIHELKILERAGQYQIQIADNTYLLGANRVNDALQAVIDGHRINVYGNLHNKKLVLFYEGDTFNCTVYQDTYGLEDMASEGSLAAPMNGAIVAVQAKVGDRVTAGDTLVIMEAMKMEHAIKAPSDGVVSDIFFEEGDQVSEGAELVAVTVAEGEAE
jgi:3-methylcrotonyl-CoA carboxylase alpha subunit